MLIPSLPESSLHKNAIYSLQEVSDQQKNDSHFESRSKKNLFSCLQKKPLSFNIYKTNST